jgi:hypothetical protein
MRAERYRAEAFQLILLPRSLNGTSTFFKYAVAQLFRL